MGYRTAITRPCTMNEDRTATMQALQYSRGKLLYEQPPLTIPQHLTSAITKLALHIMRRCSFRASNLRQQHVTVDHLQQILQAVLFPESVEANKRFYTSGPTSTSIPLLSSILGNRLSKVWLNGILMILREIFLRGRKAIPSKHPRSTSRVGLRLHDGCVVHRRL